MSLLTGRLWKFSVVHANLQVIRQSPRWPHPFSSRDLYSRLLPHLWRQLYWLFRGGRFPTSMTLSAQKLLPDLYRGGLLLSAHLGYWEWMGAYLTHMGIPLLASYKPLRNPRWNALLCNLRRRRGYIALDFSQHAMSLRAALKKNHVFVFLADQNYRKPEPYVAPLFNQTVDLSPLPAWISRTFPDFPIYAAQMIRLPDGQMELDIQRLKDYREYPLWLEQAIIRNPEQWAGWTHRLFYSRHPEWYSHLFTFSTHCE